jgi:Bardet-Biedl syndrome 7 protein
VLSGSNEKYSLFFAAGQSIRGVTKKGKEFFKLDTSHTEAIKSLHVQGSYLWSAGDYILNCYESVDGKITDKCFYVCKDRINDMTVATVTGQMVLNPVLGCQDRCLRVLLDDKEVYTHQFDSACTTISLASEMTHRFCPVIGYGLKNGGFGCIELTRDESVVMWSIEGVQTNGSAVTLVRTFNFEADAQTGSPHSLIIARDDGTVEIYSYSHQSPVPIHRFDIKVSENITGIDAGYISSSSKQEVLLTT